MLDKIKSVYRIDLLKSSGIYTFSSIFDKAIPFLLIPVLTRYLSTEDYGIISMFSVLVGLTTAFIGLGTKAAILRSYYKKDIDFSAYVSNVLFILIFSTTIVFIIFITFSDFISVYSSFPSDWIVSVVVVSVGQFVINIVLVIWQAKDEPVKHGIFQVLATVLNLGISVLLIVALGYGWEGRIIGQIVAITLFCVIGIVILKNSGLIRLELVRKYIKHALQYGMPLIPHIISGLMITYVDRIFITNMVNINETGIYTVGYQVGMIISVLASSFNKAWTPWLYSKLNKKDYYINRKIVKFTYLYFFSILILAGGLGILSPWFMSFLVGEEFFRSTQFIIWIAFGYAFNGMYFMVTCYIFYTEKTQILSVLTLISAITNIGLNYILINMYGAIGAAIATTVTYVILFILAWIWGNKVYKMPWSLRKNYND